MAEQMTSRERWLAALRLEPVDRLPFWPKLNASYVPYQGAPWSEKTVRELHDWIGSDRHEGVPSCAREVRSRTGLEESRHNGTLCITYRTPSGRLETVRKWNEGSQSWHPVQFPVRGPEDVELMREFYEDARYEPDPEQVRKAPERVREIGEGAVRVTSHGTTPLMVWIQHLAGVENGHYMLADEPELVGGLFEAMHQANMRRLEVVAEHSPADAVYSTENTSTTLISPELYRRYCRPYLTRYGRVIRGAGKAHILHMCGKLKRLLEDINRVPANAFEAFTTAPVGDTDLADGRRACPERCLVGGTNATLWLAPAEEIIETLRRDLDALPHTRGVVITSAGVHPPPCPPERIKQVADWVRSYPVR